MSNLVSQMEHIERASILPSLEEKVTADHETEDLAEVCAHVEQEVREECQDRGIDKHGGILCLYMVVERLSGDSDE